MWIAAVWGGGAVANRRRRAAENPPAAEDAAQADNGPMSTLADFSAIDIDGRPTELSQHLGGSAVLVVNTASQCGLTPQYEGLQALHERFGEHGLTVLGFPPCDQFGHQEPGTESEIAQFCSTSYGVASRSTRRSRSTAMTRIRCTGG